MNQIPLPEPHDPRTFNQRIKDAGITISREPTGVFLEKDGTRLPRPDHVSTIESFCRKHFNVEI